MAPGRVKLKAQDIIDIPAKVVKSPFANFLCFFRRKHPNMEKFRVLSEAPVQWNLLNKREKNLFEQQVWESRN